MTIATFLWIAAAALFFAASNTIAYNRGNDSGYNEGLLDGAKAKIRELTEGKYEVEIGEGEE